MTATTPKFRVAISGAGIGGLTLAVTIGKFCDNVAIDLYEAASAISTIGAGIVMWERTRNIMEQLGLDKELVAASSGPPPDKNVPLFHFRRGDQPNGGFDFYGVFPPHAAHTLHRAAMIETLRRNLPASCTVHLAKRLTTYASSGSGITLSFADGSTASTDVLIGADGIKSATRQSLYQQVLQVQKKFYEASGGQGPAPQFCKQAIPKWTGTVAYRALLKFDDLEKLWPGHNALKGPHCYSGKGKHIIAYPLAQAKSINFIVFVTTPGGEGTLYPTSWVEQVTEEEVAKHVEGWEPEVLAMIKCVENPTKWAVHVIEDLPISAMGNVAILGDAVHAMTTHIGCGAGQAIEDAYILGRLLAHPSTTLPRIPEVFKTYEAVRLPASNEVVHKSRLAGLLYEFNCEGYYDGSNLPKEVQDKGYQELSAAIMDQWKWQWTADTMDKEWARIESTLPAV